MTIRTYILLYLCIGFLIYTDTDIVIVYQDCKCFVILSNLTMMSIIPNVNKS